MYDDELSLLLTKIKQIHPQVIDMSLDRVNNIASKLSLTRFNCPVVTVAGTNGKASCIKVLENIYSSSHYKVGCYLSPKLLSVNDQIRLNNENVSTQVLCLALKEIDRARGEVTLTEFEFMTLAALYIFKNADLDIILLEVGMGGRDDAVNIVEPDLSIVTTVDLDHQQFLGDDREKIGEIKAGIFRSHKPAICGDVNPPQSLINFAKKINAKLYLMKESFSYGTENDSWYFNFNGVCKYCHLPKPRIDLPNAAIALMAISLLEDSMSVTKQAIYQGIDNAQLPGRFQIIEGEKTCVFDVAHNGQACNNLRKKMLENFPHRKIKAVVGMLKDKDIKKCLCCFTDIVDSWYLGDLNVERACSSDKLCKILDAEQGKNVSVSPSIKDAFIKAKEAANENDVILVFGSFITVAETLVLEQQQQPA